jgi:hypothetical protein
VARAMLEAVCFQTREVLDAMKQDARLELRALRVDGGATKNDLLMQLQVGPQPCRRAACVEEPEGRSRAQPILKRALCGGGCWTRRSALGCCCAGRPCHTLWAC